MSTFFEVTYRLRDVREDVERFANAILLEQTFETPLSVVDRYPDLAHRKGSILSIENGSDGSHLVRLGLPDDVASESPAQFLNVAFGNAALHREITFEDVQISPAIERMLGGPAFGVDGMRDRVGAHDRPLTCTAIKPVGLSMEELVTLCREFAEGGIDIIKDDHYLADQASAPFHERVRRCSDVVREIGERQQRRIVYVPNLTGTPGDVARAIDQVHDVGVGAVMMAPYLMGLPTFHAMARRAGVPVLAHPSHSSSAAMAPGMVWGKLPRLFGADASIFASTGGRFSLQPDDGRMISAMLSTPLGGLRRCFPVPAGGMSVESAPDAVRFYGNDVILLVGGSLLQARDLRDATRRFVNEVREAALLQD
jgi:ribulose-bisphosphate carboxylase large chain